MTSFEDYQELQGTGFSSAEPVAPEDEFFHSLYVSGKTRKNHVNIDEQAGKMQIRGVEYNLDEVHMVITHTKEILVKEVQQQGQSRNSIECFSFKDGAPPWYGTKALDDGKPRQCPQTSAERSVNSFCSACRAQIVVAGIYCKQDGTPVTDSEGKPEFIFIRGKGMKYSNVSEYLAERFKEELPPIFEPVTEQSMSFEKAVVNNKRFVTKITRGTAPSQYGEKDVFVLEKGVALSKEAVLNILQISKKTVDKFNEKFDWSKRKGQSSGYAQQSQPEGMLTMEDDNDSETESKPEQASEAPATEQKEAPSQSSFSFDDIKF
jgi:hypothetical protein